jgi:hypothetical protein
VDSAVVTHVYGLHGQSKPTNRWLSLSPPGRLHVESDIKMCYQFRAPFKFSTARALPTEFVDDVLTVGVFRRHRIRYTASLWIVLGSGTSKAHFDEAGDRPKQWPRKLSLSSKRTLSIFTKAGAGLGLAPLFFRPVAKASHCPPQLPA